MQKKFYITVVGLTDKIEDFVIDFKTLTVSFPLSGIRGFVEKITEDKVIVKKDGRTISYGIIGSDVFLYEEDYELHMNSDDREGVTIHDDADAYTRIFEVEQDHGIDKITDYCNTYYPPVTIDMFEGDRLKRFLIDNLGGAYTMSKEELMSKLQEKL